VLPAAWRQCQLSWMLERMHHAGCLPHPRIPEACTKETRSGMLPAVVMGTGAHAQLRNLRSAPRPAHMHTTPCPASGAHLNTLAPCLCVCGRTTRCRWPQAAQMGWLAPAGALRSAASPLHECEGIPCTRARWARALTARRTCMQHSTSACARGERMDCLDKSKRVSADACLTRLLNSWPSARDAATTSAAVEVLGCAEGAP